MRHSYLTSQPEAEALVVSMRAKGWFAYCLPNPAGCWEVRSWRRTEADRA